MNDWSPVLGLPLWVWLFVLPSLIALACVFAQPAMGRLLAPVQRLLDAIYLGAGILAAGFMVTILLLIVAQMISRWVGVPFHGSTELAGYAMACTSFFALAHALTRGAHIRVSIFLNMGDTKSWLDPVALYLSAITATYFSRYAIKTNGFSKMLNDRTQGQDQIPEWVVAAAETLITPPGQWGALWADVGDGMVYTPVWIPQMAMSAGTILLAVCLWDMLCRTLLSGDNPIRGEAVE